DLFSINRLMDASYSYNVQDTYVTAQAGNWSNGNTWAAGSVPPSKSRVVIDHDVTLNQNVTVVEFTLNNGVTFTASDANPRNLTVFKGTSGDHVTFTINGTWDNGNGGSTVIFTGGTLFPQTGNARHLIRGSGASLDNIVVNRSQGSYRVGVKFGTGFSVINKFRLANDGIISEQLPSGFYGQDAILEFNDGSGNTRNINADNPAWSATQVPNRIRIMSGKLLLNSWKSFSGLLTIENGAEFDVNGNGNGQLTMQPNASIINHGTISGSTIIYQRTFAGHTRWAMVSSPAKNGAIAGANGLFQNNQIWTQGFEGSSLPGSSAPNVRFFNESVVNPAGGMRYLAPTGANFESGRGYIAYMYRLTDVNDTDSGIDFGNTVFSQTGAVNTFTGGEFSIPVSYTDGQGNGWNLVGNPFPSYLEWNSDNWNRSNVGNYFYVWNPTTNEYQARTFNNDFIAGTGAGAAGEDVGDLGTNLIAPFQGFWVRATGSSPTLTVQAAAQSATSTPFLSRSVELPRITFHAEAEDSRQSMTSLFFSDDASAGIDVNDAFQLTPLTDSYISLFTKVEEESMLINNLPSSFETIETPMYAVAVHEGSYSSEPISLTWSFSSALPEDMSVELVDMVTGDVIDVLNTSEYQFNLDAPMSKERPSREVTPLITTTSDARFMLKVNLGESTSVDVAAELPSEVSLSQNYPNPFNPTTTIQFAIPSSIEAGSTVRLSVFDMLGREVAVLINEARPAGNHTVSFDASALGSGVYVYRLQAGSVVQTRKMTLIK
ncbi:MAG: T9SS type A sorting domain-containing protein, partial [Balneolales bacterium]|nr:T9SS type A sorting domain-containing protein [Balneolales bacterium]